MIPQQQNVVTKLYKDKDNIKFISFTSLFFLTVFWFFFNMDFFVIESAVQSFRIVIIGYALLVLVYIRDIKTNALIGDGDNIGKNFGKVILWTGGIMIVLTAVPFAVLPNAEAFLATFRSHGSIALYLICIVGFAETMAFVVRMASSSKIGLLWASVAYSLLHGTMVLFVTNGSIDAGYWALVIQNAEIFIELFIANILFYVLYKATNYNVSIVTMAHGLIDMKKVGII